MHAFPEPTYNLKYIAHTPTMRTPQNITWDKEVIYKCFWSLLVKLHQHNLKIKEDQIQTVVCFGLGTGVGGVPVDVCAAQMVLAYKHFVEGLGKGGSGGVGLTWRDAYDLEKEIEDTCKGLKA